LTGIERRTYAIDMARTRLLAAAIVAVATAPVLASTRLIVVNRPTHDKARLTYSSTDALGGLSKGAGTDPSNISANVFLRLDDETTRFVVPAGAYDGRTGWIANDASRALFANRDAPAGPTGVHRTTFATGRRVKLVAKNLGDVHPLALTRFPFTDVELAYVVTNGGETATHCTRFAQASCEYTPLDGGTGWKLRCNGGTADLDCGPAPVCGNGVRETGEQCDGGAGCTTDCHQGMFSCCQGAGQCIAAPVFSLQFYLFQWCGSFLPGSSPYAGYMCGDDGTCTDAPIDPIPICCQREGECYDEMRSTGSGTWYAQYNCLSGSGIGGGRHIVVNATCGANGTCVPQ
jgi:hypothetical protein